MTIWLLLVSLLAVTLPAQARPATVPITDLTALARYFPDTTVLFGAVRTDDAFINTLDGLMQKIGAAVPGSIPPGFSLRAVLDEAAQQYSGDFATVYRTWMGNTAAVAITNLTPRDMAGIVALEVTDRKAAEQFFDQTTKGGPFQKSTRGKASVWTAESPSAGAFVLYDDALLYFGGFDRPPLDLPKATLKDSTDFKATLRLLPGGAPYDSVLYLQMQRLAPLFEMAGRMREPNAVVQFLVELAKARGSYAAGFAFLDGRALTMDIAGTWGDTTALDKAGFSLVYPASPVDLQFAANIPADATLVVQSTGLGSLVQFLLDNTRAFDAWKNATGLPLLPMPRGREEALRPLIEGLDLGDLRAFGLLAFKGMTGMDMEQDVLPLMDGNFAAYVLPIQPGVFGDMVGVLEATDPAALQATADALAKTLEENGIPVARETVAGAEMYVVPISKIVKAFLAGAPMPPEAADILEQAGLTPENLAGIDLVFGVSGDLLVAGHRDAVDFSLKPAEASLAADPTFVAAQAYMLPGAQEVWYMNPTGLKGFVDFADKLAAMSQNEPLARKVKQGTGLLRAVLGLLESGSITCIGNDNGDIVARFVLTLAK